MTLKFTYLIPSFFTILISEASIEATFAPVSIFAITLFTFKSGSAICSFQPTTRFSLFSLSFLKE